ncbi:Septin-10 [Fukomys damarensis]|uniref:Septin-10 n=1 Tax=Fukomys damarensis TaxID=885580 RepID=A0A091DEW7_FUKDA|nr:Septin-10 [Fukomys damarensis]
MADYAEVRHPGSQTRTTAEKATGTSQGSDDGDNDHEDEDVESGSGPPCPCPAEAEEPEARRRQFLEACRRKEAQLKQAFARRVKEKEAVLREAERQLQDRFEQLERKQHRETLRLEEKRRALEEEMLAFSKKKTASRMLQSRVSACTSSKKKDKDRKKDQGYRFELLCFDVKACETRGGRKEAEEWEEAYSPRV